MRLSEVVDSIIEGLKATPGNIVGAPVDIANLALGLATGKGTKGFVDKPIGGSKQINSFFGIKEAMDPIQAGTEIATSFISPGVAAKAIIVPAALVKDFVSYNKAVTLSKTLSAKELYEATGTYRGPVDDILRAVVSDEGATLKTGDGVIRKAGTPSANGPTVQYNVPLFEPGNGVKSLVRKLPDVLDHPKLYEAVPNLRDVNVRAEFGGWNSASYSADDNTIRMGGTASEVDFMSMLLHEVQHAVQSDQGMTRGGNPGMFIADQKTLDKAIDEARRRTRAADEARANAGVLLGDKTSPEAIAYQTERDTRDKLVNTSFGASKGYRALGGEAEARAVEKAFDTKDFTALPLDLYDVDLKSLLSPLAIQKLDEVPEISSLIQSLVKKP